jgi:LuxR family maltose regulon positive regulatory protein
MIARDNLAGMGHDAARGYELAADDSPWRALACLLAGTAHHLMGDRARACDELDEGVRRGGLGGPAVQATCLAQLALLRLEDEDWEQGAALSRRGREIVVGLDADSTRMCVLVFAVSAFACAQSGDIECARRDALEARRRLAFPGEFAPWYEAEARIALARAELRLSDAAGARTLLAEASRALHRIPDAPVLGSWIDDAWQRADTFAVGAVCGPTTLTTAELRVLRFLPSHLSFREVAERLHVSANTVKTQAHAVYRKLDASSRSEAVARARDVGLVDG